MSSLYQKFISLLPTKPELFGTVTAVDGINYTIRLADGSVTRATSAMVYAVSAPVYVKGNVITGAAQPSTSVITIDI